MGTFDAFAQVSRDNEGSVFTINIDYGFHLPAGDLVDRFGASNSVGGGIDFISKNNLIFGLQAYANFGNEVKQNPFASLAPDPLNDRLLPTANGEVTTVQLKQRGQYYGIHFGKLFGIMPNNPRSGIRLTLGGGYMQHKIRVQDDPQAFIAVIAGDYKSGWDKLTSGMAITGFLGWQLLSLNRRVNFSAGIEYTHGLTQGQREFDFELGGPDNAERVDVMLGVRLRWSLPIYLDDSASEIFY